MKKGDLVKILTGKDRGKTGKVIKIDRKTGKITVEGVNMYKKHSRPKKEGEKGEIVTVTRPFDASNALLVCGSCNRAVRESFRTEKGLKVRYCRKCGSPL